MDTSDRVIVIHVTPEHYENLKIELTRCGAEVSASLKKSIDGNVDVAVIVAAIALGREAIRALRDILLEHVRSRNLRYIKQGDMEIRNPDTEAVLTLLKQLETIQPDTKSDDIKG
jgi:hypothetical protein